MRTGNRGRFWCALRYSGLLSKATAVVLLAGFLALGHAPPAQALPSFARQTGQPCGTCHTDFAGLTPFGRRFKIGGYTYGGGAYRTALFPSSDDSTDGKEKKWVPPISMMAITGFTNTQAAQPPPTAPYNSNNNVVLSPVSFFWGGAITDHLGAFAQVTYNAPPPGGFGSDPFGQHTWTWDNTDIRYADSTAIGRFNVTYGITANNNPTVQDPWNTTPAWAFPYAASTIAPTPGAGTIINGAFAAHVGSVGAYAYINDVLYLEASAYRTLDFKVQNDLGTDPFGAPGLFDAAPYWRVAFEPHWGNNWLMIGTFGMIADVHPWTMPGTTTTTTFSQTDKFTDIGVDSQYQYQGDNYWFTLRGTLYPRIPKTRRQLPQRADLQPDQRAQRGARLCLAGLRQSQQGRADRPIFQYLGQPRSDPVCGTCQRLQPEQQRLDRRDRLHPVRQQLFAGMAVVQRARRAAIHLVRQIRRHHRRREG